MSGYTLNVPKEFFFSRYFCKLQYTKMKFNLVNMSLYKKFLTYFFILCTRIFNIQKENTHFKSSP